MADKPIFAIGLEIANPTFSIPDPTTPAKPGGWTVPANVTAASLRSALPRLGHPRAQRFSIAPTASNQDITSYPLHQAKGCAQGVSTPWYCVALIRASGLGGTYNGTIRFKIFFRNSSGGSVASHTILTQVTNLADWALVTGSASYTLGSAAHHAVAQISLEHTANGSAPTVQLDIAFLGIGLYSSSAAYAQLSAYPDDPTMVLPSSRLERMPDPYNYPRFLSWDGFLQPRAVRMNLVGVTDADRTIVETVWGHNRGRRWESSAVTNPSGGQWPVLLVPGVPTCPHALYGDFEGDVPDWSQWGVLTQDPPDWNLPIALTERM